MQTQVSEWKRLIEYFHLEDTKLSATINSCYVVSPERFTPIPVPADSVFLTEAERAWLRMTQCSVQKSYKESDRGHAHTPVLVVIRTISI